MSAEAIASDQEDLDKPQDKSKKTPKAPKPKKRMSNFEILRTILQRTHERKLPYWLRNMGGDDNVLILCSEKEEDFAYGSPTTAIAFIELVDPELQYIAQVFFENLLGFHDERPLLINIKDQISEFAKSKGTDVIIESVADELGNHYVDKEDTRGQVTRTMYVRSIDCLFHYLTVNTWWDQYKDLLTSDDPNHIFYPYRHENTDTYSVVSFAPPDDEEHPIRKLYPLGFRVGLTKGLDVLLTKGCETLPYAIEKEELIAFICDGSTVQTAHRITANGWRMLVIRPNSYVFPALNTPITKTGEHVL